MSLNMSLRMQILSASSTEADSSEEPSRRESLTLPSRFRSAVGVESEAESSAIIVGGEDAHVGDNIDSQKEKGEEDVQERGSDVEGLLCALLRKYWSHYRCTYIARTAEVC